MEFLRHKLLKQGGYRPVSAWIAKHLPKKLDVSEYFFKCYRATIQAFIFRKIVETLKTNTVYFMVDERTVQSNVLEPLFWENISFEFSQGGMDQIWELAISADNPPHLRFDLTPWDALLITLLFPDHAQIYSPDWLKKKQAHWLVLALFFNLWRSKSIKDHSWQILFDPEFTDFPLRFILIEEFAKYISFWHNAISSFRLRVEARESFDLEEINSFQPIGRCLPHINEVIRYWSEEGMLGMDDCVFIRGTMEKVDYIGICLSYKDTANQILLDKQRRHL